MTTLPRDIQPNPALEERVVSDLVAAGLVRRRRRVSPVWLAVAAVVVLAFGVTIVERRPTLARGNAYVVLLYEDSTYRPAPAGHNDERVAVLSQWADSLDAVGKFERAARLSGPGPLGGLFIIRATDDADAARIAAGCPFHQWGGRVELKRVER